MNKRKDNEAGPGGRRVKTISIRIPARGADDIRARAASQDRTVSQYMRALVNADFIERGLGPLFALSFVGYLLLAQIYDYFQ